MALISHNASKLTSTHSCGIVDYSTGTESINHIYFCHKIKNNEYDNLVSTFEFEPQL